MLKQISVSHRGWKGGRFSVALEGAVRETVLTDKHPASRNNVDLYITVPIITHNAFNNT